MGITGQSYSWGGCGCSAIAPLTTGATRRPASALFGTASRQAAFPPFDPDYHCIYEDLGDGRREYYRTSETDGERTDYALIQRYTVDYSGRRIVVVHCAGITTLGTLCAAQYLASHLNRPTRPGGTPVPLPPSIEPDSSLEVLLEVKADATKPLWTPSRVELCKLFVGHAAWSARDDKWESSPTITLVCEGGDPQRPLAIKFDDKEEKMERTGQAFRLLVGLCLQARETPDGYVDLAKLLHNSWIWGPKEVDETYVKRQLALLKVRHLHHEALSTDGGVRLQAKVVDHFSRRVMGCAVFDKQPTSLAIRTIKGIASGLWTIPLQRQSFRRELQYILEWYHAHRPHTALGGRTPNEVYFHRFPAHRRPRFEPRPRWPTGSPCVRPWALVKGKPGVELELEVTYYAERRRLPIAQLRAAA